MIIQHKKSKLDLEIEKLTPPRQNNWNWGKSKGNYSKDFSSSFIKYIFPYLLRNAKELGVSLKDFSLLDIGCGWAPLAIPFVIYQKMKQVDDCYRSNYLGIDIRQDAIEWLSRAYAQYSGVNFVWHQAAHEVDYIGAEHSQSKTIAESNGQEANYTFPEGFHHNVQWSGSVFTHLTPQAALQALKSIHANSIQNSIQVNTWLIIDDESRYAMLAEIADRQLTIDVGDFFTYSENNPMLCTAYKIDAIERLYNESGLEIVRIDRGSWRGMICSNEAKHYQDIIISRPIKR